MTVSSAQARVGQSTFGCHDGEVVSPTLPAYPRIPLPVTLCFCGYVVFWYLQGGFRYPALGAIRFELIWAMMLGAIALAYGSSLASPVTGHLVALLACMAVQVPFSYDFDVSWNVFIDQVLKYFCMSIFIVAFVKGPRELRWFLGAFLFACLKMGQEGFVGQLTGSLVWQNQGVMRLHGSTPSYGHPNSFSGMAVGTFPFIYYLFPAASRRWKVVLITLAVFSATVVLFTGSRTGYIGWFGFLAFVLYKAKHKFRAVAAVLLVAAIGLPFVPADYAERFNSIFTGVDKEGQSTTTRLEILHDAWRIFLDHPLGVGVGAFPAVREKTFGRTQDTHNLYLEVATNLGIQGLGIFLLFVVAQLLLLSRLATSFDQQVTMIEATGPPDQPERAAHRRRHLSDLRLMRQAAHAVQAFLVVRLVLGLFGMDLYEIYWWFAMGLAIALYKMERVAREKTQYAVGASPPPTDKRPPAGLAACPQRIGYLRRPAVRGGTYA
jgi:O-antigen ligase